MGVGAGDSPERDCREGEVHEAPAPLDVDRYLAHLGARMARLDLPPTASFEGSYAAEFDTAQATDRAALRRMPYEFETSLSAGAATRNRYTNILANEATRVVLRGVCDGYPDYINANYVRGVRSERQYIATQAPLPHTIAHFWQMVWEARAKVVVMLTREQEDHSPFPKCDRYWPDLGERAVFENFVLANVKEVEDSDAGIVERTFKLTKVPDSHCEQVANSGGPYDAEASPNTQLNRFFDDDWHTPLRVVIPQSRSSPPLNMDGDALDELTELGESVIVTQLQYLDWPDQDVPDNPDSMLRICRRVDDIVGECADDEPAPTVVHCSAGVGRTGTFIAVHRCLQAIYCSFCEDSGRLIANAANADVLDTVRALKEQRSKMVQTPEQYRFIYIAVAEGARLYRERIAKGVSR